jgi:hypothetical protein
MLPVLATDADLFQPALAHCILPAVLPLAPPVLAARWSEALTTMLALEDLLRDQLDPDTHPFALQLLRVVGPEK